MKITKAAKKRWFEDNILDFELHYKHFDDNSIKVFTIAEYCCFEGLYIEKSKVLLKNRVIKSVVRDISRLQPWQIFFKYHKYCLGSSLLRLDYTKYAAVFE